MPSTSANDIEYCNVETCSQSTKMNHKKCAHHCAKGEEECHYSGCVLCECSTQTYSKCDALICPNCKSQSRLGCHCCIPILTAADCRPCPGGLMKPSVFCVQDVHVIIIKFTLTMKVHISREAPVIFVCDVHIKNGRTLGPIKSEIL